MANSSGSAYVFLRTGTSWSQQDKLTASDPADTDDFGWFVALSGETAVVGAPFSDDAGSDSGSAYVFARNAGSWSQQSKLTASDAASNDAFGYGVAIDGGTAVVGAEADDSWRGSAYVFVALTADLSITKSSSPTEARVGQNLTYTLTVTNNGPETATSITVTDTLPGAVTFVSSSTACTGTTTVTCTAASLVNGDSVEFLITVTAPNTTGTISNTASVSAASPADAMPANDSVTLVTSVLGFPPVPAVGTWALGALALAFGAFIFVARRRRALP